MIPQTYGSLFTGYGGLDRAVEMVFPDIDCLWVSDIEPASCRLLERRAAIRNLGDVSKVDWNTVPDVDLICGGFPCQDLSHAGKRAGLAGARSGLWAMFAQAIEVIRPQYALIENVRGLLSAKTADSEEVAIVGPKGGWKVGHTDRAMGAVIGDLADIGYGARWVGLPASGVGAPHRRFRIFILATDTGSQALG